MYVLEAVEMRLRSEPDLPKTLAGSLKAYANAGLRMAEDTAWAEIVSVLQKVYAVERAKIASHLSDLLLREV